MTAPNRMASTTQAAPVLSVCIATMNRAQQLLETLEAIVSQAAARDVELVIIDSSSDDATARVVEKFESRVRAIRYQRRAPAGVDAAYAAAVDHATGAYCWLMTDDDLVSDGAISAIRDAANDGVDVVLVNAMVYDAEMNQVLEVQRLPVSLNRRYRAEEYEAFFRDTAGYVSFIGAVVVRRAFWNERFSPQFLGSEFAHVRVIFNGPLRNGAWVLAKPYVRIRYGAAHWTPRAFRVWMFQWPSVLWSVQGIPDSARKFLSPKEPWRSVRTLLTLRAKGAYGLAQYRELLMARPAIQWTTRARAWLAAVAPGVFANALLIAYVRVIRPHSPQAKTGLRDFRHSPYYYRNYSGRLWRHLVAPKSTRHA